MLPGTISWSLIIFPFWGAFLAPTLVAYYIIAFDVYWLYRSIWTATLALLAHFRIKAAIVFNWLSEAQSFLDWQRVQHIIVIPTYQEPLSTLRRTLQNLTKQTFPRENLTVVVSFEAREGQAAKEKARKLKNEFKNKFGNLMVVFHPDLAGEVKGKSSNVTWGAKLAKQRLIDQQKHNIDYATITSNDADALVHPQYFAYLTFKFFR